MFSEVADVILNLLKLDVTTPLGSALHFFTEDCFKIFTLIYVTVFVVALFRSQFSAEKIKLYLQNKSVWLGYFVAVLLGVITPFCSCSSIPLFIGFVSAGVPFGIAMAFLISSPLISEVAATMLLITPEAGIFSAMIYIFAGIVISVTGGFLCDKFGLSVFLQKDIVKPCACGHCHTHTEIIKSTVKNAHEYAFSTLKTIWLYVLLGLVVGAFMHGYIPQELFIKYLGQENPFAVIVAAVAGIPVYANHNSVLPILHELLLKQVPVGTSVVMLMSITAISLPEMIMLNKVLKWKMLGLFCLYLLFSFILVGYLMNFIPR